MAQKFKVDGHEHSLLPEGKKWKLVWSDEFDGTELDENKWDYRLSMCGQRHRTWGKEGVTLDGNSNAVFTVYEKDGEICSSQLQTGANFMDEPLVIGKAVDMNVGNLAWPIQTLKKNKFLKKYGYFECRCKLQQKEGWWSAFWLQSPIIGSSLYPEISGIENDIMESFHVGKVSKHCNHFNGYGPHYDHVDVGERVDVDVEEYHIFGMWWDKEKGYTFYMDGKERGHFDGPISHVPQFILLSTEVNGYRTLAGEATEEAKLAVGDKFIVDYVRVFDEE